jgi:hypothetical protein
VKDEKGEGLLVENAVGALIELNGLSGFCSLVDSLAVVAVAFAKGLDVVPVENAGIFVDAKDAGALIEVKGVSHFPCFVASLALGAFPIAGDTSVFANGF